MFCFFFFLFRKWKPEHYFRLIFSFTEARISRVWAPCLKAVSSPWKASLSSILITDLDLWVSEDLLLPNHFVDSLELKTCSWLIKPIALQLTIIEQSAILTAIKYSWRSIQFGMNRHRLTPHRMRTGEWSPTEYSPASWIWSSRGGLML